MVGAARESATRNRNRLDRVRSCQARISRTRASSSNSFIQTFIRIAPLTVGKGNNTYLCKEVALVVIKLAAQRIWPYNDSNLEREHFLRGVRVFGSIRTI